MRLLNALIGLLLAAVAAVGVVHVYGLARAEAGDPVTEAEVAHALDVVVPYVWPLLIMLAALVVGVGVAQWYARTTKAPGPVHYAAPPAPLSQAQRDARDRAAAQRAEQRRREARDAARRDAEAAKVARAAAEAAREAREAAKDRADAEREARRERARTERAARTRGLLGTRPSIPHPPMTVLGHTDLAPLDPDTTDTQEAHR